MDTKPDATAGGPPLPFIYPPPLITLRNESGGGLGHNKYFLSVGPAEEIPLDKRWLAASLHWRKHSPDGFNHGYGGSGPSQLALALCLYLYGPVAVRLYQRFKSVHIAALPDQREGFMVMLDVSQFTLIAATHQTVITPPPAYGLGERLQVITDVVNQHPDKNLAEAGQRPQVEVYGLLPSTTGWYEYLPVPLVWGQAFYYTRADGGKAPQRLGPIARERLYAQLPATERFYVLYS